MANCMQAVIGIGSNMGDRLKNINGAVRSLSRLPKTKITACSHVYETARSDMRHSRCFTTPR